MSTCNSCGAPIIWAMTDRGKKMPVDQEPTDEGTFVLIATASEPNVRRATFEDRRLHRDRHTSHFATCPDAAQWRSK